MPDLSVTYVFGISMALIVGITVSLLDTHLFAMISLALRTAL